MEKDGYIGIDCIAFQVQYFQFWSLNLVTWVKNHSEEVNERLPLKHLNDSFLRQLVLQRVNRWKILKLWIFHKLTNFLMC